MTGPRPGGPAADRGRGMTPPARGLPGRRVITVMLLAVAVLDLARCGVTMASARYDGPTIALVVAGVAAAVLSLRTAHAYESRRRWPAWAALLVGAASGPQAAASGFRSPYTMVDTATAALGVLLAVAVLATAGRTGPTGPIPAGPGVSRGQSLAEPGCLDVGCDEPRVPPSALR
ncbi:MAG TPA: hypothetical protein VH089_09680 [Streptosporangiaceae bacterium]|nr:hypothetical protein [Streptosporangiaceae bacterium]